MDNFDREIEVLNHYWEQFRRYSKDFRKICHEFLDKFEEVRDLFFTIADEDDSSMYDFLSWETAISKFDHLTYIITLHTFFIKYDMDTKKDLFNLQYLAKYNYEHLNSFINSTIEFLSTQDFDDERSIKLANSIVRTLYKMKDFYFK